MRRLIVACFTLASVFTVASCDHEENPDPALTITPAAASPSEALSIDRPTDFSAIISHTARQDKVTWSVTGAGSISPATGFHTVYTPPPGIATTTATLTATTDTGLTASVTISPTALTLTAGTIPGLLAPVTVLTDAEDIPHIRCQTAIDCLAVQGYIHARDRFFMMDFLRHVARARLAEMIGVDGLDQDVQIRTLFVTRDGKRLEDALVAAISINDPESKKLLDAYVAGVNAYLRDLAAHPIELPGEYAQLPFPIAPAEIAPWTPEDTLAMARLQQFQLSETLTEETAFATFLAAYGLSDPRVAAWIRSAAPTGEQAHTLSPTAETIHTTSPVQIPAIPNLSPFRQQLAELSTQLAGLRANLRPFDATTGSNNWVVDGAHSATGAAMVANDPHLSLQYPPLFHLSVMTSALASDHLDLAGGAFPGIPGALVGRGQHVGWGVTVVGYDVTDLYQEGLSACPDPTAHPGGCVIYKGAPEPLVIAPQTFLVRTATGLVDANSITGTSVPTFVAIAPHHGPIVKKLSAGAALSVRWTGMEGNTNDLRAFWGLDTATDVDSAVTALHDYATGAQNFVLADDQGNIAYDPHAFVPVRKFADPIANPSNIQPPWFPLKGFDGSAEWGDGTSDCAATGTTPIAATCWIADATLPHGKNPTKGYFMTANADPTATGVTDDNNPLAHPPYFSFDWDDSTGFRATRIQERLEATLAANNNKISLADMQSIQSDHVSRPGKFFVHYLDGLTAPAGDATFATARAILAKWETDGFDCPSELMGSDPSSSPLDTTGTVPDDSAGCFLFHAFLRTLFTRVFTDDLAPTGLGVNQLQAMKAMMYMLSANADSDTAANSFCSAANPATGAITTPHTCSSQVVAALDAAYAAIAGQHTTDITNWTWGKVHTMQPVPLLPLVTNNYQPGPYARPGGAFTVDVGTPSTSAAGLQFPFGASGNVRHISLMSASTPTTKMQLPGPEQDGPVQPGFQTPDLLGHWVLNQYFDFLLGNTVDAAAVSSQTFSN